MTLYPLNTDLNFYKITKGQYPITKNFFNLKPTEMALK